MLELKSKKLTILLLFAWLCVEAVQAQIIQDRQPSSGPGGKDYQHQSYVSFDETAKEGDGYWMYTPAEPAPDSANVIVFLHGWAVTNPMVYGAWIKHMVGKGNIVIYPRYQKRIFSTYPKHYAQNSADAIVAALKKLEEPGLVKPRIENIIYAGHSYGAAIASYFGVEYSKYNLPKPKGLLIAQPGTSPAKSCNLETYADMESDIKLVVTVGHGDHIVGDLMAVKILNTAGAKDKNLLLHISDGHGAPTIHSSHATPCAVAPEMDNGQRNYIITAAINRSDTDAVDYYCYWKLSDALSDCAFYGQNCDYVFGDTEKQRYMGTWSDGKQVKPITVFMNVDPKEEKEKRRSKRR